MERTSENSAKLKNSSLADNPCVHFYLAIILSATLSGRYHQKSQAYPSRSQNRDLQQKKTNAKFGSIFNYSMFLSTLDAPQSATQ